MAVLLGKTAVHRVAVNERLGVGITACGIVFALGDAGYDPNGKYEEQYLDWLFENRPITPAGRPATALCCHCRDRTPAWKLKHKVQQAERFARS